MTPIGIIHSCFKEKFGIPRQAGLAPSARAELELFEPYGSPAAVRGLETFSHIWVIFRFHGCEGASWRDTVRPPRLGGNQRIGVFASRSGFRPNALGMSVVKLDMISDSPQPVRLHISGVDMLDKTPVLDIKPYIPYADCRPEALGGFAPKAPPPVLSVTFSDKAESACRRLTARLPLLRELIVEMIQGDPRPAYYQRSPKKSSFGTRVYDLEVKWVCRDIEAMVTDIEPKETAFDR